jgi:hypothetical protein
MSDLWDLGKVLLRGARCPSVGQGSRGERRFLRIGVLVQTTPSEGMNGMLEGVLS